MTQHQHESSEELEGCLQFIFQNSGETDTNNQNEVGGRQHDTAYYLDFLNKELSPENHVQNSAPPDTSTTEDYNRSGYSLANSIYNKGIPEPIAYKEGVVPEPIQGSLECRDSAPIQPGIPVTNQESAVRNFQFSGSSFIWPVNSIPSAHNLQSGYNESFLIQPEISAPSKSTPPSCGKTENNLSGDDQHEMADGLSRYDGDLSEESEVGTKRKNRKRMKSMQSEAEKKKKIAEKSKQNHIRKNEAFVNLRQNVKTLKNQIQTLQNQYQTLQNQNQTLQNQNHKKDRIIANLTSNQAVFENFPNNPQSASAENKLHEEEFTDMMHQANVEAFDQEKFLKLMNNWFRSKDRSEIRVNDREPKAGVVRVERGEQKMKIRVLTYYRKMESEKERYKKCKEDHERNGLA
ncbi:uncharacterized protein LOC135218524 isoform X2 [Macrobrachium nipponense]